MNTKLYGSLAPQDKQEALPFLTEPHDALRLGVRSLKEDASVSHPVEAIQANVRGRPGTCSLHRLAGRSRLIESAQGVYQ